VVTSPAVVAQMLLAQRKRGVSAGKLIPNAEESTCDGGCSNGSIERMRPAQAALADEARPRPAAVRCWQAACGAVPRERPPGVAAAAFKPESGALRGRGLQVRRFARLGSVRLESLVRASNDCSAGIVGCWWFVCVLKKLHSAVQCSNGLAVIVNQPNVGLRSKFPVSFERGSLYLCTRAEQERSSAEFQQLLGYNGLCEPNILQPSRWDGPCLLGRPRAVPAAFKLESGTT
jgi:hypothetical protein